MVDGHAHLEEVDDLDSELHLANEMGVVAVIAVGSDKKSNEKVLGIAKRNRGFVFPALGLHPWNLGEDLEDTLDYIESHIEECVALGEVGLDFKIKKSKELQIEAFKGVLELAKRFEKPVIVHSRWAWRETFELVRASGVKAVFHWYSGPLDILRQMLDFGCYVSATPAVEYSEPHRLAMRESPLDRLLLESDSPVAFRGVKSRPSDVVKVARAVAQLIGASEVKVAEKTTENATRLFGLKI